MPTQPARIGLRVIPVVHHYVRTMTSAASGREGVQRGSKERRKHKLGQWSVAEVWSVCSIPKQSR